MMIPLSDPRRGRVMLRSQLLASGYTDKAIARLVKDGTWVRIRHGTYTEARTWNLMDAAGRHALLARAVVARAQTPVAVSHTSGLPFYDAPTWKLDLRKVHTTRMDGKAGRDEAGVTQHSGAIVDGDIVEREALPIMSATRLALETTIVADTEPALCVVNHLLHERLTTPRDLRTRYESMQNWPGTLRTDVVLRLADPRIESVGESRFYFMCFQQGLPAPVPQYEIKDSNGQVVARVDFAWPELGLFVEFDGRIKYEALLKPGQRASDVVLAEKRREEMICRITGWRCIRIVWADLERPERIAELIRAAMLPTPLSA